MTPHLPSIIIAIDGYSSSGKSSMAKVLARRIGYRYIDSGAMYRAVTLYAMRNGMILADGKVDEPALIAALPQINIDFNVENYNQRTLLNGEDVEDEIRQLGVSSNVSPVAAIPAVRHALVAMQQKMGESKEIVMDGRDIGTTVFPDAEMKVFVNASAETRARRRFIDMQLSQIRPSYLRTLKTYINILESRNALLKQNKLFGVQDFITQLDTWDEQLARASVPLVKARRWFLDQLSQNASEQYASISENPG